MIKPVFPANSGVTSITTGDGSTGMSPANYFIRANFIVGTGFPVPGIETLLIPHFFIDKIIHHL